MSAPKRDHSPVNKVDVVNSKRSTPQLNDEKLFKFISWASESNFCLNNKVVVQREGSCAQYGMVAVEDIAEGEELFQIPRTCLLTPQTSAIADCLREDGDSIQGSSGWVPLLVALMYEYNNPQSFWRPYLDLVPDFKELDLPMFWSSTERETLLKGTGVAEAVSRDLANIEKEFSDVVLPFVNKHTDKFSPVCKDLEFYKKMVAFVMAYSFTEHAQPKEEEEGDSGSPPPVMVPMADILNHVAKNNAHLKFEKDALKMVAVKSIKKGEEVFNTYGELANWHLLHMYGFAEEYPQNHWDTVNISTSDTLEASKCLDFNTKDFMERKMEIVKDMFGEDASIVVGISGVLEEQEMKSVLKICSERCLENLEEMVEDGWESDDEISLEFDAFCELPKDWKQILSRSAELTLKRYCSSLEKDEEKVKSKALTSRQKYSLLTAYGQKKILKMLISSCCE